MYPMRTAVKMFILMFTLPTLSIAEEAQYFSKGSQAGTWNLYAEIPAKFEAKVVDILCEITGECASNCGYGKHQLGLLRTLDNVLVFPNKNAQPVFSGASLDLLAYCNEVIEVDGLLLEDDFVGAKNIFLLQLLRSKGDKDWTSATTWTKEWNARHPNAPKRGPWFRKDPRVLAHIATDGYFGLGLEEDERIKDELWP